MDDFRPKKTAHATLPFIMRPTQDERFIAFSSETDGFEAFIHRDVGNTISREAYKAAPNETIGLLAGRVLHDVRGPYTLVLAAQGAREDEVEATPSHVRISASGHAQVRNRLESSALGLDIIGWYHSHPKYSAHFSPVDITEQSTWRDRNHLGIVISGLDTQEPLGVYRGPKATRLSPMRFPVKLIPEPTVTAKQLEPVAEEKISPHVGGSPEAAVIAAFEAKPPALVDHCRPPLAERMLGFIPWILAFGLLSTMLVFIRLNYRVSRIEKTLSSIKANGESNTRTPAQPSPTPLSLTPTRQDSTSSESVPSDKSLTRDNPVTKAHPLMPNPVTPPRRPVKPRKSSQAASQKVSKPRSGSNSNRPSTTETVAPSHPGTSEQLSAPHDGTRPQGNDQRVSTTKP